MTLSSFKVIVVGGGPVGLTAAHALHHAGIDFVVLEQRESVVLDQGASLVLAPSSLRVMHQFGLLERLREIGCELLRGKAYTRDGRLIADTPALRIMRKNHGSGPIAFHRAQLIEALYEGLPAEAKHRYHLSKKVVDIESSDAGVKVTCADGGSHHGSMVLGTDGVHSKTREMMRALAMAEDPTCDWDGEPPFTAQYRCMWCSFPRPLDAGRNYETQAKDHSIMFITGRERGWIFLYERLPEPTNRRVRYTEQDMEKFVQRFAEYPISKRLKVKDVYPHRITAGMANLEEGILKHWSWGRIVMAGDACYKYTPNAGRGFNNGIQDIVVLCNKLHAMLESKAGSTPDVAALESVFAAYRKTRKVPVLADAKQSVTISRMHAWETWKYYIMARYVMPWSIIQWYMVNYLAAEGIRKSWVLDYIPAEEPFRGLVSWRHPLKSKL
ncbi:hypothetical protein BDV59DRAFT_204180 [Aspergillus ambiguus]|uniref:FAD-dependent oxidoreductase n=1 Tax=Aspergillus ambiguus TaxID=176160 RepID=UPI003CCDB214